MGYSMGRGKQCRFLCWTLTARSASIGNSPTIALERGSGSPMMTMTMMRRPRTNNTALLLSNQRPPYATGSDDNEDLLFLQPLLYAM